MWNTDANGNDTTNTIGTVSGISTVPESLETSFHQDLNGDGVVGVPAATAASPTSSATQTALVTVASNDTFVFSSSFHAALRMLAARLRSSLMDFHRPQGTPSWRRS